MNTADTRKADTTRGILFANIVAMSVLAFFLVDGGVAAALGMIAVPCVVALLASRFARARNRRFLIVAWIVLALMVFGRHIEEKQAAQLRATPSVMAPLGV